MGAGGLLAQVLRRRLLGSLLLIAAIVGAAGGLATGLVGGGIRARTALDRLVAATRLPDVMVADPSLDEGRVDEVRTLPGVEGAALIAVLALHAGEPYFAMTASVDGRYGVDVDTTRIVRGRAADPAAADEVVLGENLAAMLGVYAGDTMSFQSYSPEQVAAWRDGEPTDEERNEFRGPTVSLEVVGITRHPVDVTNDDPFAYFVVLPPGFLHQYAGQIAEWDRLAVVDVGVAPTPAQNGAIADAVMTIAGEDAVLEESGEGHGRSLAATLDFVGLSMMLLGGVVALTGLVVGGTIIGRAVGRAAAETASVEAMGMTRSQRARTITMTFVPCAVLAGLASTMVAVLSSALLPFGLARRTEPDPGLWLHGPVLAVGVLGTVVGVLAIVRWRASREVRRDAPAPGQRRALVSHLARHGLPIGGLLGIDLAVGAESGGTRSANHFAMAAMAMATAAGVGAVVIAASIVHLESTPADYGWTWDLIVPEDAAEALADEPRVAALGLVVTAPISLDGRPTIVRGITSLKGVPPLRVVDGRPPEPGEIALGRHTMDDLGVAIGDTVTAQGAGSSRQLRIVGEAVFAGIIDLPEAATGAAVHGAEFDEFGVDAETGSGAVVTLVGGADRDEFTAWIEREYGEPPNTVTAPGELARLREIEAFPWILCGFLVAIGVAAIVYAILATVRRRGRDLAVLRSLGLAPRGVVQAVTVQSALLAGVGGIAGIGLGVVVGRAIWRAVARSLGVVVTVQVPWASILAATVVGVAGVAVIALAPARTAARRSIAAALRAE